MYEQTKTTKEERIFIRLEKELKNKYKEYCLKNSFNMSIHIRELIEQELKKENKDKC